MKLIAVTAFVFILFAGVTRASQSMLVIDTNSPIAAINALAARVQAMQERNDKLKSRLDALDNQVSRLKTGTLLLISAVVGGIIVFCVMSARKPMPRENWTNYSTYTEDGQPKTSESKSVVAGKGDVIQTEISVAKDTKTEKT